MKSVARTKVQKAISKIESGEFDELVVDNLLGGLRQYSGKNLIFRELADFVAHSDERDEGVIYNSLEAFYLSIKYFTEFTSPEKSLNVSQPFPKYIIKLMKYQIDKCKNEDLKEKFNVTKERLKSRIDTMFSLEKKTGNALVKKEKVLRNNIDALQHILGFIGSYPAFEQENILSEVIGVIKANDLEIDEDQFRAQSEKIILSVLLLMHEAEFKYDASTPGFCKISCDKTAISHNQRFVDSNGKPVEREESFGSLQLLGHVVIQKDGKDLNVCYPVLSTTVKVDLACDDSIFGIEPLNDEHPNMYYKKANFEQELILTENGQLGAKNA